MRDKGEVAVVRSVIGDSGSGAGWVRSRDRMGVQGARGHGPRRTVHAEAKSTQIMGVGSGDEGSELGVRVSI